MKTMLSWLMVMCMGMALPLLTGCQRAEEAGEETGEMMEEAGEATMDAADEAANQMEQAADEVEGEL